jgi:tetratricopeptide (TPR) repeat protein
LIDCKRYLAWPQALDHVEALIAAEPNDSSWLSERALVKAALGQLDNASQDARPALQLGARRLDDFRIPALLALARGKEAEYREACARMLKRFAETRNPAEAQRIMQTCLLRSAPPEPDLLLILSAVVLDPDKLAPDEAILRSVAMVRTASPPAEVRKVLESLQPKLDEILKGFPERCLWLGLVHAHLGETTSARQLLERAGREADPVNDPFALWDATFVRQALRAEVERVLKDKK